MEDVSAEPRLFVSKEAAITVRQAWSPLARRDRHAREEQAAGGHAWGSGAPGGPFPPHPALCLNLAIRQGGWWWACVALGNIRHAVCAAHAPRHTSLWMLVGVVGSHRRACRPPGRSAYRGQHPPPRRCRSPGQREQLAPVPYASGSMCTLCQEARRVLTSHFKLSHDSITQTPCEV